MCDHHTFPTWTVRAWYRRKSTPSFDDALTALRITLWQQRITAMSTHARLPTKITDALLNTLAEAA